MTDYRMRLRGPLAGHLAAAVAQLSADTPYSLPLVVQDVAWDPDRPRLFQDYVGDLSGRYLRAIADAVGQGLDVDRDKAAAVLSAVLDSQNADGTFGPDRPARNLDHGAAWGHGLLLDGLLAARDWAPDGQQARLGTAIDRLARAIGFRTSAWVEALHGREASRKFALDPLSAVLPLTTHGDKESIASAVTLSGALPANTSTLHMHGYLLALRGMLEAALITGDVQLRDRVRAGHAVVREHFRMPHGAVLESLSRPWDVNTEGCGTADWVMLNLRLAEVDDADELLDEALLAACNGLLHAQRPSGHFGCETLSLEPGLLTSDYAPEAWWCCTFHGIHALATLASATVRQVGDDLAVRLPLPVEVRSAAGESVLEVGGDYPYGDRTEVVAGPAFPRGSGLRIRVPGTASVVGTTVDGVRLETDASDGWIRVAELQPGSRVVVEFGQHTWFDLAGAVGVPPFANSTDQPPDLSTTRCAVFRGPVLLAATADDNAPEDLLRARQLQPSAVEGTPIPSTDGGIELAVRGHDTFRSRLRLAPLATADRSRNDRLTRIYFTGIATTDNGIHDT